MTTPDCAEWNLWLGPEVEGTIGIGVPTLFVRKATRDEVFAAARQHGIGRVWFCKEWADWETIVQVLSSGRKVCLEVTPETIRLVPVFVMKEACVYLKVDTELKDGDHVCVGPAFADEAFRIGTGAKVEPVDYAGDRRLA